MENLGEKLKQKRISLNKSHEQIHEQTRITVEHLEYLESNDFTFLPETYVKSYLKSYATALGLDADEILNEYAEIQTEKKHQQDELQARVVEAKPPKINNQFMDWALGVGFIVLIVSLILVYVQYRTQIHGTASQELQLSPRLQNLLISKSLTPADSLATVSAAPIELEIKTANSVWIQFTDEENKVTKYLLSPEQKLLCVAEQKLDIQFGNSGHIRFHLDGSDIGTSTNEIKNIRFTVIQLEKEVIEN
ncbi:MAG: helix-turn-helix domain-containing protein [bacterium]